MPCFGGCNLVFREVSDLGFRIRSSGFGVRDVQNSDFGSGNSELAVRPGPLGGRGRQRCAVRSSISGMSFLVSAFGYQISGMGFGYEISDISIRVSGFGHQLWGIEFRVSGVGTRSFGGSRRSTMRDSSFGYEVSGIEFRVSCLGDPISGIGGRNQVTRQIAKEHPARFGIRVSGIRFRVSGFGFRGSGVETRSLGRSRMSTVSESRHRCSSLRSVSCSKGDELVSKVDE